MYGLKRWSESFSKEIGSKGRVNCQVSKGYTVENKPKAVILPEKKRWQNNLSNIPRLAKQQIRHIIESGAAQPLVKFVNKTFSTEDERRGMLKVYVWHACNILQPFLKLQEERRKQGEYLERLKKNLRSLERHEPNDAHIQDLIKILRLKKDIACQYGSLIRRGNKDLPQYALAFFLNLFFSFLNTEARNKLIANLLVVSGFSSAVCFEAKGEKQLRQFFPSDFSEGKIKIVCKKRPLSKSTLHKRCLNFHGDDASVSEELRCGGSGFCSREADVFTKRRKRAERLFPKLLQSDDYRNHLKERLSALKCWHKEQKINLGPKAIVQFRLRVTGEFLMREFLLMTARLSSPTTIYLEDLARLLQANRIRGFYVHECFRTLSRDRDFLHIFKLRFSPTSKNKK